MTSSRAGAAVFAVAALLLVSMGGAIVAAPIIVPLLVVVVVSRHPSRWFTIVGALLAGLTLGEAAWAITYRGFGESQPWIVLLPLVVSTMGFAVVARRSRGRSMSADAW